MKFDIIGDIHGYADGLIQLLEKLGYDNDNGTYHHPDPNRRAIFVGDFIDRGPKIRETLSIVKSMVDNDGAFAVLGNHEYNALCFHTLKAGQTDSWLRGHSCKNIKQHLKTLKEFKERPKEWGKYLSWFMTLPLFLDLGDIRVVHASWIPSEISKIVKWTSDGLSLTEELLQKSAQKGTEEYDAIDRVLKGLEIRLPKDAKPFSDKDGHPRDKIRIRWWETAANKSYGEMIFPSKILKCGKKRIDPQEASKFSAYNDRVPVFFGHYWRKPEKHGIKCQADNICCLDYSAAKKGKLVAYRWEGESKVNNNHLFSV